jgi:hypothetical protein
MIFLPLIWLIRLLAIGVFYSFVLTGYVLAWTFKAIVALAVIVSHEIAEHRKVSALKKAAQPKPLPVPPTQPPTDPTAPLWTHQQIVDSLPERVAKDFAA